MITVNTINENRKVSLLLTTYNCRENLIKTLKSIEEQGKLTPELKSQIEACKDKTLLEDLYAPYKPK